MRPALRGFIGIKLMILALGAAAYPIQTDRALTSAWDLLRIWNRWDAPHYLSIAEHGYQAEGDAANFIVFFPLYPWLVRAAAFVVRDHLLAAFVVSTIASLLAAELLWRLVARDHGDELADRAVWCLAVFPTAYFLHIGYTESLFLALVLGTFLAARTERWWTAGLLGFLASLTRSSGIVLVPALLLEAFLQERAGRKARWGYLAADAPLLGLLVYLGLNQLLTGNAFHFLSVQKYHWYKSLAPPWVGLGQLLENLGRGASEAALLGGQELLFTALGLVAVLGAATRLRPSYAVWTAGNWLLYIGTSWVMSVPRYTLALFPIFVLFAMAAKERTTALLLFAGALLLQGLFALRFALGLWSF